jgi:hypothetical protein
MDRFAKILSGAQYALAIIGDASTGEFLLVDPALAPIDGFLGIVAITQGRPRCEFVGELPRPMLDAIREEFCRRFEAAIVELERVFDMPAN